MRLLKNNGEEVKFRANVISHDALIVDGQSGFVVIVSNFVVCFLHHESFR